MPLVSALAIAAHARIKHARVEIAAQRAPQGRSRPDADEQLFEPRSALGELLHALSFIHPIERG